MDAQFRDWAELPVHIVDLIVTKLDGFSDYSCFCGLCPKWRNIAHEVKPDYKEKVEILAVCRKKLPMLIFLIDENSERRSLFNVSNRKTYEVKLPLPFKYRFVGSSHGWLFCLGRNMVLTLVNPCTNACVSLPVFKSPCPRAGGFTRRYFDYLFIKGILLSDPHSSDPNSFNGAVIYGGNAELAYFKSGLWNYVELGTGFYAIDIISYKGKFYAINPYNKLIEIDTSSNTTKTIIPPTPIDNDWPHHVYLVESQGGELLKVKRLWRPLEPLGEDLDDANFSDSDGESSTRSEVDSSDIQKIYDLHEDTFTLTADFKVFKMTRSLEDGSASWVELDDIGEQALFVGDNHAVSVSTIEFPECLKNSIYFTCAHHQDIHPYIYLGDRDDAGIFNLEDKSFQYHHVLEDHLKYMQPPIWFVLNPQEVNSNC